MCEYSRKCVHDTNIIDAHTCVAHNRAGVRRESITKQKQKKKGYNVYIYNTYKQIARAPRECERVPSTKKKVNVCVTRVTICSYYYVYPWQNNKQKSRYLRTKCVKARGISSNPLLRTKNKGHTYLKITQQPKHTPATHLRVFPYSKCTHRVLRAPTKKNKCYRAISLTWFDPQYIQCLQTKIWVNTVCMYHERQSCYPRALWQTTTPTNRWPRKTRDPFNKNISLG